MKFTKAGSVILLGILLAVLLVVPAGAAEAAGGEKASAAEIQADTSETSAGTKAIAVCVAIGLAAAGGAIGMGVAGGKAADGISRQPEMEGKIRTTLMLDLVFIETAIIYALLVVILVIFVL